MQGAPQDLFPIFLIGTGIILVFALFVILFVVGYRQRQIKQQNRMLEMEAEYQHNLLMASVESQERERERIARDLHDDVGAMLSTIRLSLVRFNRKAEPGSVGAEFSLQAKELVEAANEQVREISRALLPSTLGRYGLKVTLEDLFKRVEEQTGVKTRLKTGEKDLPFDSERSLGIYRIVQELTNNSLKHAEASEISLKLTPLEGAWQIEYQDNGKGFKVEEAWERKSLGLKNLESRASAMGGSLTLNSQLGKGTQARLWLPNEKMRTSPQLLK